MNDILLILSYLIIGILLFLLACWLEKRNIIDWNIQQKLSDAMFAIILFWIVLLALYILYIPLYFVKQLAIKIFKS